MFNEMYMFVVCRYILRNTDLKVCDKKRIYVLELWYWTRMLGIPWTAKRTSLTVMESVGNPPSERDAAKKLTSCGRISNRFGGLERDIIFGGFDEKPL